MEYSAHNSFRLLKKIKDPKFSIDELHNYNLSMHLGLKDFQLLVTDNTTNRCVLLEDYVFESEETSRPPLEVLRYLFDDHHLLMAGFWKSITFATKNRKYSLVPLDLYSSRSIQAYLKFNSEYSQEKDEVMVTYHEETDFINIFAVEREIVKFVEGLYQNKKVKFIHQSSALINGLLSKNFNEGKSMALYIDRFGLHIIVTNGKKLIFYNQYPIKKFDDYLKYIHLVAKELNINLTESKILLYGYLGKQTPHYSALKETIHRLSLGNRPQELEYGYVFDEISDHQYFDLFCLHSSAKS